jgi:hypothetical protein
LRDEETQKCEIQTHTVPANISNGKKHMRQMLRDEETQKLHQNEDMMSVSNPKRMTRGE